MGNKIGALIAREILDSRGNPTVEVEVCLSSGSLGRAAVPSGASTGAYEAIELRDGEKSRYNGKGVLNAINNIKEKIAPEILEKEFSDQGEFDKALLQIDGTKNKSVLGANAILGVSLAYSKACAVDAGQSLFKYVGSKDTYKMPVPLMNILNGGAHANNGLDVQEFMIAPTCGDSFSEALRAGVEIFHNLKSILNAEGKSTAVGDEGGFAPELKNNEEALELISKAVEKSGYKLGDEIKLALDVASTEFFSDGFYKWEGAQIPSEQLGEIYKQWKSKYPIVSIEDGFAEDDWEGWSQFTQSFGKEIQLVGDDLFVTNPERLQEGISRKAANALLVKVNQIGTLSETRSAVELAQNNKYKTVMSHRSGETEDVTIADLAVALNCEQIKTGSLCRTDRVAKYNQLLRIEEELGHSSEFWGNAAFN